jgi:hypothetical protein
MSAILPFTVESLTASARSKKRLQVYEVAHSKVEDLRNQSFSSLATGSFTPTGIYGATGLVTIEGVDLNGDNVDEDDVVTAIVSVNYPEKGATKTLTIKTLIAKDGLTNND